MAFVESFAPFFADFGVNATLNGAPVRGVFDAAPAEAFGLVSGFRPVFILPTASAAAQGQTLVIEATAYTVAEVAADGTGMDRLTLEKQ